MEREGLRTEEGKERCQTSVIHYFVSISIVTLVDLFFFSIRLISLIIVVICKPVNHEARVLKVYLSNTHLTFTTAVFFFLDVFNSVVVPTKPFLSCNVR